MSEAGTVAEKAPHERLMALRLERGLTQQALADAAGTDKSMIGRLERGSRRLSSEWIQRLAGALDVRPGDLFPEGAAPKPTPRVSVANGATVTLSFNHTVTIDQAQRILAILKEGTR